MTDFLTDQRDALLARLAELRTEAAALDGDAITLPAIREARRQMIGAEVRATELSLSEVYADMRDQIGRADGPIVHHFADFSCR